MSEADYDNIIAPMLLDVANRCEELGMSIVARVSWADGESGITQKGFPSSDIGQEMTRVAAHCHGNVDAFCMAMVRDFDVSRSAVLRGFARFPAPMDKETSE